MIRMYKVEMAVLRSICRSKSIRLLDSLLMIVRSLVNPSIEVRPSQLANRLSTHGRDEQFLTVTLMSF
ncbi:hypothetical protein HanPSC8_Chr08g0323661 [Helianthus annuus]|nr:hypothetical protein HanPSC8_Chr08g0323661 [Helianthus annuus]